MWRKLCCKLIDEVELIMAKKKGSVDVVRVVCKSGDPLSSVDRNSINADYEEYFITEDELVFLLYLRRVCK